MLSVKQGRYYFIIDNLSIAFYAFAMHMLTSPSVDKMLQPRYVNYSIILPLSVEMALSYLKHMNFLLLAFTESASCCLVQVMM